MVDPARAASAGSIVAVITRPPDQTAHAERMVSSVTYPRDHAVGIVEGSRELSQIPVSFVARETTLEHLAHFAHGRHVLAIGRTVLIFRRVLDAAQVQDGLDQGDVGGA